MMNAIQSLVRVGETALEVFLDIVLLAMTAIILAGVFFRYVLGQPLMFSFEISTVLFAWIVFIGLVIAYKDGFHLGVDVLDGFLPPRARHALNALRNAIVAVISVYMTVEAVHLFMQTSALIASLQITVRIYYFALPLGFGLMAVAATWRTTRDIHAALRVDPSPVEVTPNRDSASCS
jgi:TRAP-type C4-dicarboxylate transport system permease small subunit